MIGWFDVSRKQGFVDAVGERQHDAQQQNHPRGASTHTVFAVEPYDDAHVHAGTKDQQYKGGSDGICMLKHHTQLRHRQHGGGIHRYRDGSHVQGSQRIVMVECMLQAVGWDDRPQQAHSDEPDQDIHQRT